MKLQYKLIALTLLSVGASTAFAAPSAELKVIGRVSAPTCTISLANGGTIDYGTLNAVASSNVEAQLPEKTLVNAFTVTCDAPTALGVTFTNNRVSSNGGNIAVTNASQGGIAAGASGGWGLGLDASGNKIGGYTAAVGNAKVDGATATWVLKSAQGEIKNQWAQVAGDETGAADSRAYAFSIDGTTNAIGKVFTADYSVAANLAPVSTLNTAQTINLDGSVTVQVNYL